MFAQFLIEHFFPAPQSGHAATLANRTGRLAPLGPGVHRGAHFLQNLAEVFGHGRGFIGVLAGNGLLGLLDGGLVQCNQFSCERSSWSNINHVVFFVDDCFINL